MARPRVGDERREQILAAFEACVLRNGIEKTTLEDIAQEAGQPRSLVRYFAGNRDELTSLLIDRLVTRTAARLVAMHARGAGSATAYLEALFGEFYEDEFSNRVIVELWHMSRRSPELRARLFRLYGDILRTVASEISGSQPGLDPDAAFDATYATYALGLGVAVLSAIGLTANDPARMLRAARQLTAGDLAPNSDKKDATLGGQEELP